MCLISVVWAASAVGFIKDISQVGLRGDGRRAVFEETRFVLAFSPSNHRSLYDEVAKLL